MVAENRIFACDRGVGEQSECKDQPNDTHNYDVINPLKKLHEAFSA